MSIADLLGAGGTSPAITPVVPLPGVSTVWDVRNTISADLDRQVQLELDKLKNGETMAALNIRTKTGVNVVVAHRMGERLTAAMWIGKSGWDQPITEGWEGAVSVRGTWGGK